MNRTLIYMGGLLLAVGLLLLVRVLFRLFQKEGSSRVYVYDYEFEL